MPYWGWLTRITRQVNHTKRWQVAGGGGTETHTKKGKHLDIWDRGMG